MWLCLNEGYLSIVQDKENKDMYLVRSRHVDHITNYFDIEPERFTGSDYVYRIRITEQELTKFMMNLVNDVTYTNFKDSVVDKDLKKFYGKVWGESFYLETDEDYSEYMSEYYMQRYASLYDGSSSGT